MHIKVDTVRVCVCVDACVLVCVDICIHSAALSSRSHFGFQFHRHFRFNASSVICIFYLLLLSLHERLERNAIDEGRERQKMTTRRLASRGDNANNKSSQLPHQILTVFYRGEGGEENERTIHLLHKFENCSRWQNNFSKVENVSHCLQVRTSFLVCVCECVCIFMWLQQLLEKLSHAQQGGVRGESGYLFRVFEYSSIRAL